VPDLFWADIDEAGTLALGTYTAGFFDKNPEKMPICSKVLSVVADNEHILRVKLDFPLRPPFLSPREVAFFPMFAILLD
jgi:hypothetical protein